MKSNKNWNPDVHIDVLGSKIDTGDRIVYTSIKQGYSLLFAVVLGYTKNRIRIVKEDGIQTTISAKHVLRITEQIDLYDPKAPAHTGSAKAWFKSQGLDV